MRLRDKLIRFMYGRNGMDKFNMFLFVIYFILMICSWIIGIFSPMIMSLVFNPLMLILAIYMTFRCFSRNIYKRQIENRKYLAFSGKIKEKVNLQKNKFKDRKTHVYKKCPYCKAILRLKRIKGNHSAVCPRCTKSFEVRVR